MGPLLCGKRDENRHRNRQPERDNRAGDQPDVAVAQNEGQQDACDRDDDRQHQQEAARGRYRVQRRGGGQHQPPDGSEPALGGAPLLSVVEPAVWNSRSNERDRQSRCGKRDNDAGNHQGLRHRVIADARRCAPPSDDAEQEEHAAAEQIEGDDLAKRLRIRDQAVEPKSDRGGGAQSEHRHAAHRFALRSGAPASSRPRVAAIVRIIATSMPRISGLASAGG